MPISNYSGTDFFKSASFFTQMFTAFTLSFRTGGADLPLNQNNKENGYSCKIKKEKPMEKVHWFQIHYTYCNIF